MAGVSVFYVIFSPSIFVMSCLKETVQERRCLLSPPLKGSSILEEMYDRAQHSTCGTQEGK